MVSLLTLNRKRYLIIIIVTILVIGFIAFLLLSNYRSQINLQQTNLGRLQAGTKMRAAVLSHFFANRVDDMGQLASRREISAYFENRDLGMSMEYGLWASLQDMTKDFDRFLNTKKLAGDRIYSRAIFLEKNKEVLVDLPKNGHGRLICADLLKLLSPAISPYRLVAENYEILDNIIIRLLP